MRAPPRTPARPGRDHGRRRGRGRAPARRPQRPRAAGRRHRRGGRAADGSAGVRAGPAARSRGERRRRGPATWRGTRAPAASGPRRPRASHSRGALQPGATVELTVGPAERVPPGRPTPRGAGRAAAPPRSSSSQDRSRGQARASASCASSYDSWSVVTSRARAKRSRTRRRAGSSATRQAGRRRAHRFAGIAETDHPQHDASQLHPLGVGQALVEAVRGRRHRAAEPAGLDVALDGQQSVRPGAARSPPARARAGAARRVVPRRPGSAGRPDRAPGATRPGAPAPRWPPAGPAPGAVRPAGTPCPAIRAKSGDTVRCAMWSARSVTDHR